MKDSLPQRPASVVDFAHQILRMQDRLDGQETEIARLRYVEEQYHELLNQSLAHSKRMVGQTLSLILTPGVMDACQRAANPTPYQGANE